MERPPKQVIPPIERPEIGRQELVNLFVRLRQEKGVRHPDGPDFNSEDGEVKEASEKFFAWVEQEDAKAEKVGTQKAHFENLLSKDLFYIDAGFDDPGYLDEVVSDFLEEDLANAEAVTDEDLSDIISKFSNKIVELRSKLDSQN